MRNNIRFIILLLSILINPLKGMHDAPRYAKPINTASDLQDALENYFKWAPLKADERIAIYSANVLESYLIAIAIYLEKKGANLLVHTNGRRNLLFFAASRARPDLQLATMLLNAGLDPNHADADGTTPIDRAIAMKNFDFIHLLFARGARAINAESERLLDNYHQYLRTLAHGKNHQNMPLIKFRAAQNDLDGLKRILESEGIKLKINQYEATLQEAFWLAAESGSLAVLEYLYQNYPQFLTKKDLIQKAVQSAARRGQLASIKKIYELMHSAEDRDLYLSITPNILQEIRNRLTQNLPEYLRQRYTEIQNFFDEIHPRSSPEATSSSRPSTTLRSPDWHIYGPSHWEIGGVYLTSH